ncbi:MAG: response regulator [Elusimicrobiota bacterium]
MKKILIVEDSKSVVFILTSILEDNGYEVLAAEDADTAVALANNESPDLIVLDINMPGGGLTVFRKLKDSDNTRLIPIIFASGQSRDEIKGKMTPDMLDVPFLSKPFSMENFVEAANGLINTHASIKKPGE